MLAVTVCQKWLVILQFYIKCSYFFKIKRWLLLRFVLKYLPFLRNLNKIIAVLITYIKISTNDSDKYSLPVDTNLSKFFADYYKYIIFYPWMNFQMGSWYEYV